MGGMKHTYIVLVRKPDGKRELRRSRRRWENIILGVLRKLDGKERADFDWIWTGSGIGG
jgi:hypothetical protein